jgi:hypothetical protein
VGRWLLKTEVKTERDIERWRVGEEEVEDDRRRAAKEKGSRRGSRSCRGGSYKGGRDMGRGGPRRPI